MTVLQLFVTILKVLDLLLKLLYLLQRRQTIRHRWFGLSQAFARRRHARVSRGINWLGQLVLDGSAGLPARLRLHGRLPVIAISILQIFVQSLLSRAGNGISRTLSQWTVSWRCNTLNHLVLVIIDKEIEWYNCRCFFFSLYNLLLIYSRVATGLEFLFSIFD